MAPSRREFLCHCGSAIGAGAALAIERFSFVSALAQAKDYRALVCIFLNGGNDSDNVVIPIDGYGEYAEVRTGSGLQIPSDRLLPIDPPSHKRQFGLHPALSELHGLWGQRRLALVCNTGPLIYPMTREEYRKGTVPRPRNLFSHSDQQSHWQTARPDIVSSTGWGGRTADRTRSLNPPESIFPMMITVAGVTIFTTGQSERVLALAPGTPFGLDGFDASPAARARYSAMVDLLGLDSPNALVRGAGDTIVRAIENADALNNLPPLATPFPDTTLGNQLRQVAQLIKLNQLTIGLRRQVFFCQLGGFDTHANQTAGDPTQGAHATLWSQVSRAMQAFDAATEELEVSAGVTTFTLSDFARTFKPNGGRGTDHAWGGHQFVMGGSVAGGEFYGRFPPLLLGDAAGSIDTDAGAGARGRWIPSTAVDQYAATLASWFGVSSADMPAVFPNLDRFDAPDLRFVG